MTLNPIMRSPALAALLYFVTAAISLSFNEHVGGFAFLWSPTALMVAPLVMLPRRAWPLRIAIIYVTACLASGLFGVGWTLAPLIALCDTTEGALVAYFFSRGRFKSTPIGSLSWLIGFVAPVAILAPVIVCLPVLASLLITGRGSLTIVLQIVLGHALGNTTFVPFALMLFREGPGLFTKPFTGERRIEAMSLLGLVAIVSAAVFSQHGLPILFMPMVPLILVSFRLGYGPTMLGITIVGAIGTVLTIMDMGPIMLIHAPLGSQLLFLQFFLTATVVTALPVAADLESRGLLHDAMRVSEERFRMLAEYSADMLLHLDARGRLLYASPAVEQIVGYTPAEMVGRLGRDLVPLDQLPAIIAGQLAIRAAKGKAHSFEYEALTKSGGRGWLESRARALFGPDGAFSGSIALVQDVTERKASDVKMREAAMTDVLTGLNNRRAFLIEVEQRQDLVKETPDCIALLDIDRFKRVNDRFGHDAGDAVLANFARILRQAVRHDDIIARIGGEEFVILFPATEIQQALLLCERLRLAIARTITDVEGVPIAVTVSGGVSLLGPRGIDEALKEADLALYSAKRGGRDQMALAA